MRGWSLRSRLFVLIVLPLVLVAALAGGARFLLAEKMSERLYDNTLLVVALTISRDVILSEGDVLAEQLLDSLTGSLGDPVYYRVMGPGGRFMTGYSEAPAAPPGLEIERGVPTFYDAVNLGQDVRVVALEEFISEPQFGGWVSVEVWQTTLQRERLSRLLLFQSIAIMATVIVAAGLLVWFGIRVGLRPLLDLREAVRIRSPDDLAPIRRVVPQEVRSLVEAMNGLFMRLERAFAMRDAFIADAAHQLRNPVAAIQAQTESLETAPDTADLRRRIARLAETARQASRLTQQLLTLERIRDGVPERRRVDLDIGRLVRDVTASAVERHAGSGIEFDLAGAPTPVRVHGDAVLIEEALYNLIDNAVRYGCPDGGRVSVAVALEGGFVHVAVADQGPGIPAALRERVFDRFFRADERQRDGSGLGLPIVRSIAEAHGGSVRIVGTHKGTTLVLALPAIPAADSVPGPR